MHTVLRCRKKKFQTFSQLDAKIFEQKKCFFLPTSAGFVSHDQNQNSGSILEGDWMEEPRLDMMSSSGRSLTAGCPSSSFEKPSEPPGLQQPPLTLPAVLLLLLLSEVMEAAQQQCMSLGQLLSLHRLVESLWLLFVLPGAAGVLVGRIS